MTGYDKVPPAEHNNRIARVLTVDCPYCGTPAGWLCAGGSPQHSARWDAWYAAHPEASAS